MTEARMTEARKKALTEMKSAAPILEAAIDYGRPLELSPKPKPNPHHHP